MYHLIFPIFGTILYTLYPKDLKINQNAVKSFAILHNALLAGFSAYTVYKSIMILLRMGLVFETNYYFSDPEFTSVQFWFYLSKYYEYFDTFLIYLNGKQPIFLQKYHHIGAVFNWHFFYVYGVDGVFLPTLMNATVHTIMYTYYLCSLLKVNVRWVRQYLTSIQLLQFFAAILVDIIMYKPPVESVFNYNIILGGTAYVSGLIVLFGKFYYDSYICKQKIKT
jgi:hypothetical protein